jgi:hypothetical protein
MCSKKFYADKVKEHSVYCLLKINKTKELPQFNQRFLDLSTQVTECMIMVEKLN